ncbi:hypothetical protein CDO52_12885 [Nocardiopsis gilva YIM 90087]|uniref:Uncharacterized protein n=1 Tax=Nocardiopsis gilva YIM 90087 TaxID=1235441 RepID=A0A223S626_9ACTN|nr:hypothetical protein [Nocardiopsis gilva]ASU83564.1 hypothetical protein CDO52_12885 [Nocardiopsis gilva YIM 90087]
MEDELTAAVAAAQRWRDLKDLLEQAKHDRDTAIRKAADAGVAQTDLVKRTDLTRETIRRITNPEAAEAVRKSAAEKRRAAKKGAGS